MGFKYICKCDSCGKESQPETRSIKHPENWISLSIKKHTTKGASEKFRTACEEMSCAFKIIEQHEAMAKKDELYLYSIDRRRYVEH